MKESACRETSGTVNLKIEGLSFTEIPGQSRLFLEYLVDSAALSRFYPSAAASSEEVSRNVRTVLENYPAHRGKMCDILFDQNTSFGAGSKALENIELLRRKSTVAVLTGQQAGLFGGPLYTVYKALSAVRMAEHLSSRGIDAVPIFWAATEDHDFDEIATAFDVDHEGALFSSSIKRKPGEDEKPVGAIKVATDVESLIDEHIYRFPKTEFTTSTVALLKENWTPGTTLGNAFCRFIASLFSDYGLVVVDPIDRLLKSLAYPLLKTAITSSDNIANAVIERSSELEASGFHAQVNIPDNYFPLFYINSSGERKSLKRSSNGNFGVSGERGGLSQDDILNMAEHEPERLSPGVMLRPVVQDFLFPTICYFGGAAEIAYFAQNSEVYRLLNRPVTPILHRQSLTLVESRHRRTLEKFELRFPDIFSGFEAVMPRLIERFVAPTAARLFADAEENINIELGKLDSELNGLDPTLSANLATRRRKILYHIGALQNKFHRAQAEKDEAINRGLRAAFNELLPRGGLQERTVGISTYLNRHGRHVIDWIYNSLDLADKSHRVVFF